MKTAPLAIGTLVRYKPGDGVYGYEDLIEADGRIPAIVMGHSPTRTRIRFQPTRGRVHVLIERSVDVSSLTIVEPVAP